MIKTIPCNIVATGKRRDGGMRYWCVEHHGDATAKYGVRAKHCRYSHVPPVAPSEALEIDVDAFPGGVGLWGAVPPVFDTTRRPLDRGVHVHARKTVDGSKDHDETYRAVSLSSSIRKMRATVTELDAIYFMVSAVFGYAMKYIECEHCGYAHLDKDWFSVHAHRGHLCSGCGKHFRDTEVAIGNPASKVGASFGAKKKSAKSARRTCKLKQADYPGGIQIWGSNPAIVWTTPKTEEEGIHVHAFVRDKSDPAIDDTFSSVQIDDIVLDPTAVRLMMAQNALPHLVGRVVEVSCDACGLPHLDEGELAFTPHAEHECSGCGAGFSSRGRLRKTIGNPIIGRIAQLAQSAVRAPQCHDLGLLPETL